MNSTINGIDPPPFTTNTDTSRGGDVLIFVVGFVCILVLLTSLTYTSYICRERSRSPETTISFGTENAGNHHLITFSRGLEDDVLVTFPTFLYSDAKMRDIAYDSSCSICLADYKPSDVVRLLPECSHLFHVRCIDTWLKVHPTCPVCRNSQLARTVSLSVHSTG